MLIVLLVIAILITAALSFAIYNKVFINNNDLLEDTYKNSLHKAEDSKKSSRALQNYNNSAEQEFKNIFAVEALSDSIIDRINGVSWIPEAPVKLEELRYITVAYWGFDDRTHRGELIVHEKLAEEVIEIFTELYDNKYPIYKISLIDDYDGDDNRSMEDNNTSAFNYRSVPGSSRLSKHSYGTAIDINPVQNPYVDGNNVYPETGKDYLDRSNIRKGMIIEGDICYNAFVGRGWIWGGSWKSTKDYQHFQKLID
ncbi:MAG: M15 family metallopeptidase [Bacillota bacterium]